ncbi:ATP-binding cassette domain-containing protein [Microbacterium sp. X-17]|uniref:ATP-binding cassette domain-containing protein n=1 Tax=Microbacterium sp. X-17 TaxID=3144404 RepID=UPI0031F51C7F
MARVVDTDVAIRATDLSLAHKNGRTAGTGRVVDGVTFTVRRGGVLILMGPTGAGKSSLATTIAGRPDDGLRVDGGSAEAVGIPVDRGGRPRRELTFHAGLAPQGGGSNLPSRLTVGEVIGSPLTDRDRRVDRHALAMRVATLLDELGLALGLAAKYPYELSAGMRQRVSLARALMLEPKLLVADDLYANLDVEARGLVLAAIARRRTERGMAALVVTNDPDAARELDADVLVLRGGHPIAFGHGPEGLQWSPNGRADPRLVSS